MRETSFSTYVGMGVRVRGGGGEEDLESDDGGTVFDICSYVTRRIGSKYGNRGEFVGEVAADWFGEGEDACENDGIGSEVGHNAIDQPRLAFDDGGVAADAEDVGTGAGGWEDEDEGEDESGKKTSARDDG